MFAQGWLLGSLVLLVLLTVLMSLVASPHMKRLREGCTRWADGSYTMSDEELRAALAGPATMITASTGGVGLLVILYLMVFKPGDLMDRIYNFSPGPATLPRSVLEPAQRDLVVLSRRRRVAARGLPSQPVVPRR